MGSYFTRTRAWVYIAFYDEYVGKNINLAAGLSMVFIIPLYWYGIHCNRVKELNNNMYYYAWRTIDKRNRLVHNMIMEHFEVHTEKLQDLLVDINKEGAKVLDNLPAPARKTLSPLSQNELAMVDEMSGLTDFVETIIRDNDLPEHVISKMRGQVVNYTDDVDYQKTRYNLYKKLRIAR